MSVKLKLSLFSYNAHTLVSKFTTLLYSLLQEYSSIHETYKTVCFDGINPNSYKGALIFMWLQVSQAHPF